MFHKHTRRPAKKLPALRKYINNITHRVYGKPKLLKLKGDMKKGNYLNHLKKLALPLKSQTNLFQRLKKLEHKLHLSKKKRATHNRHKKKPNKRTRK